MIDINKKKVLKPIILFSLLFVTGITAYYGVHKYYYKQREHKVFGLAVFYSSSQEIVKYSDNIIIGTVENVEKPFTTDLADYVVTPPDFDRSKLLSVKTENVCSQVKIIKSIKGNLKPGEVIPVMQSGVPTGEKNRTIPSSKLHKVNQRCVFFLRYCTPDTEQLKKDYKIPLYVELNPFQGHINITDDNLNFDSYELPMFKDIDNIDDLEKIINNDMKTLNNKQ